MNSMDGYRPALALAMITLTVATAVAQPSMPATADAVDDRLRAIFAGDAEPRTAAELRAMQEHVQALIERVLPSVVHLGGASGVIVDGGYVLTAGHVSRAANREITLELHDGRTLVGRTLGANHRTDTGLIRIVADGELPASPLGTSSDLERGQWCLMLGHPSGSKPGRAAPARLGRVLRTPQRGYLTSDCPMQGGDSGGPLFDMQGRVIGINSRIAGDLAVNMHVPIDTFLGEWDRLVAGEVVEIERGARRPQLGVRWDRDAGDARIRAVRADSPAARAGLEAGDVVVAIDGEPVADRWQAGRAIAERASDLVAIRVQRGPDVLDLAVDYSPESEEERR